MLKEPSKDSIKARHWHEVMTICGSQFLIVGNRGFKLQSLIELYLVSAREDVEEVTDGTDKQLKIEENHNEINTQWQNGRA